MSTKTNTAIAVLALICSTFGLLGVAAGANPVTNADELVGQHLDSIANAKVRGEIKTLVVKGSVHYSILVGGAGTLDGKAFLVSEGKKLQFMMKLPNNEYRGEQFIFDGDKDKVAFSTAQQSRSAFGNFVFGQDAVIREGLLGGVLSTAWPLANLNDRKAKLTFEGLKKMDGRDLYSTRYKPHKGSDLEITLYFDPQDFHHVETVYTYSLGEGFSSVAGPGAAAETSKAGQQQTRYRLQEKFSDFKTVDGVSLPTHYNIQFSQELQSGRTIVNEWDLKDLDVSRSTPVDARNFEVK